MAENDEVIVMAKIDEVVIAEDVLIRAIRDYKPTSSKQSQNCKIQKVQSHDRPQENTTSPYTPKIISIGPLHHGKSELQPMEDLKHEYLNELLNKSQNDNQKYPKKLLNRRREYRKKYGRNMEETTPPSRHGGFDKLLGIFIEAARNMEEEVRDHYDLSNTFISSDDFVHMLVIDGCFLLVLLLGSVMGMKKRHLGREQRLINHDILLFENQIPFFVLQKFYEIIRHTTKDIDYNLREMAFHYLHFTYFRVKNQPIFRRSYHKSVLQTDSVSKSSTLLHFYHMKLFSENHRRPPFINRTRIIWKRTMAFFSWLFVIVSSPMYLIHKIFFADIMYPRNPTSRSAMEIEEGGVRFQGSRMDLRFDEGTLSIPVMTLNHQSLCLLKNLMIFEYYYRSDRVTPYVNTYVCFLSDLIKNPGDLKVMEKHHIILTSDVGDEWFRLVSDLLRSRFEGLVSFKRFRHDLLRLGWQNPFEIQNHLVTYCEKPRHRWRAKLMKDYFGNPWSTLGVLAGIILLGFTTIQTVFAVLSYYHQQIGG